jgi:hypothetical protein
LLKGLRRRLSEPRGLRLPSSSDCLSDRNGEAWSSELLVPLPPLRLVPRLCRVVPLLRPVSLGFKGASTEFVLGTPFGGPLDSLPPSMLDLSELRPLRGLMIESAFFMIDHVHTSLPEKQPDKTGKGIGA